MMTIEELFFTLLKRRFKIKNHEQIYLQNNSFLYQTAADLVIEIIYLRLQMKSIRYHS